MTGQIRHQFRTFEAIAAEVIADAQERSTNDKVRYQWELLLGPRYCNSLLQRPINQITTLDIEQVLRPVWRKKPETGRKLLVRLRRVSTMPVFTYGTGTASSCRATQLRGKICGTVGLNASVS